MQLRERLTVIITTSAIRSHPSTEMISKVRASFALIEVPVRSCLVIHRLTVRLRARLQGLLDCPQIIVADGASIAETSELKKGKVTASLAARYHEYLQQLADVLDAETAQLRVQVFVLPPPALFGPSLTTGIPQRLLIVREKRYGYAENLRYFRSHFPFLRGFPHCAGSGTRCLPAARPTCWWYNTTSAFCARCMPQISSVYCSCWTASRRYLR